MNLFDRHGAHGGFAMNITACHKDFDEPFQGVWASDHFGLVAGLTLS